jgi:hypothetical protein
MAFDAAGNFYFLTAGTVYKVPPACDAYACATRVGIGDDDLTICR